MSKKHEYTEVQKNPFQKVQKDTVAQVFQTFFNPWTKNKTVGLGIDTNFMIQFDFDSDFDQIQYQLLWIYIT